MTLKQALEKIDASVEAYRALLRDDPQDIEEAAKRQQDAADLLAEAHELGGPLGEKDFGKFATRFAEANETIERLEGQRISGVHEDATDSDEDDEEPADDSENEPDAEDAEMYSSLSFDEELDEETDDENSETD